MNAIILYTSKHGCAEEVAKALQKELGPGTEMVNLMVATPSDLRRFDLVVLGGSIYYGQVQKQLTAYMNREKQQVLSAKTIGLYICAAAGGDKAQTELEQAFPKELVNRASACAVLGDRITPRELSWAEKLVLRVVSGKSGESGGLFEERIKQFASELHNG
ncbi:flavodoxin domain-containing protein [Paenibacillus sp. HN-1]|uniref:flavodoxin domain-containing protein n=1 Tax=Paenibacillus TaxID=44249 RepID=UPI001CA8849A|nr:MULTISPECIES: flavodoxin domain-containing protein [Paenibacillus]MBY9079213.1 flavodoxin domain-containing protein [Paenibacillus sp. CGMCC 1.18879]MBY9086936.1 flavodoxin domain-containing protein [Paenibacillus sinensis]